MIRITSDTQARLAQRRLDALAERLVIWLGRRDPGWLREWGDEAHEAARGYVLAAEAADMVLELDYAMLALVLARHGRGWQDFLADPEATEILDDSGRNAGAKVWQLLKLTEARRDKTKGDEGG